MSSVCFFEVVLPWEAFMKRKPERNGSQISERIGGVFISYCFPSDIPWCLRFWSPLAEAIYTDIWTRVDCKADPDSQWSPLSSDEWRIVFYCWVNMSRQWAPWGQVLCLINFNILNLRSTPTRLFLRVNIQFMADTLKYINPHLSLDSN